MKKKVVIIVIIILLLIVAAIGFLYFKTDIFKNNGQKFWKYAQKNSECSNIFNDENIQSIKNRKANSSYRVNSTLIVNKDNNIYNISANTEAQNSNDLISFVDVLYNDTPVINFNIIKKSNLIGLKQDDLANGYIAIKNNNIQELAKDLEIKDVTNVPNNINWTSYIEVMYLAPSDVKYITETYVDLLQKQINKSNYSKEESGIKIDDVIHTATGYKISLTEKETKEAIQKLYNQLSEDSRTLNMISSKLKLLNLPSKYTEIDYLSNKFSEQSSKLDSVEANDNPYMEIIVYTENGELLQTNIKIENDRVIKLIYSKGKNQFYIQQENINKSASDDSVYKFGLEYLKNIQQIKLSNEISEDKNKVSSKAYIELFDKTIIEYNSRTEICDSIEKNTDFEDSTRIVLNELTTENLKKLYKAIQNEIPQIYQKKKAIISENYENLQDSETQSDET